VRTGHGVLAARRRHHFNVEWLIVGRRAPRK
jgi:hypothetical protein